jgi:hypothetical protein
MRGISIGDSTAASGGPYRHTAVAYLRAYLVNGHLLRPTRIGCLVRSFRLHIPRYAHETIAPSSSMGVALATMPINEIGSLGDIR